MYAHGTILNCKGHSLISEGISFMTNSEITHSAIFIIYKGLPHVIDAQKDGVQLRNFQKWQLKHNYSIIANEIQWNNDPYDLAYPILGATGYDFESLIIRQPIKLVINKITGQNLTLRRKKNESTRMTCSEFIATILDLPNPQNWTPGMIYEYLNTH
ncbi:MAG: hypothetical protein HYR91_11095 [Flavobacteriia bacterium]|nr:hypothetical protein [Flavobacteriia bacterium]